MHNEYGTMFKQLMNERNELRKYIIDICKSLDIDTSQSVLGANCLEFYAVLSSVAKDRISSLQEQLKRKEQECEELKQTLTEIKEIAENREIFCENCSSEIESFTCDDCGYVKILQKINECETKND